jgi:TatD DNase family protein
MSFIPKEADYIDIHSHSSEREEGVFRIHNLFTSDYPKIPTDRPISIGLHPWHITEQSIRELPDALKQAVALTNVLALGEAGLDRVIQTPMEQQLHVFRTQVEISIVNKKPLIIHCVKAFPELLNLRKVYRNATPWIIHGFNANQAVAAECVTKGIYISLSQRLFRNHEKAGKVIKVVPVSMIFAETDDDPVPIQEIYNTISNLYGLNLDEVKRNIFENFKKVFGKS